MLNHLKDAGFNREELARVYRSMVRPVADYMSVVYHSMLTDRQDEQVERMQSQALKIIYGKDVTYAKMRELAEVSTLRQRRIEACDSFASKASKGKFSHWFPVRARARSGTRSSGGVVYEEKFARCDRLRNSPLYYMRRRLNGRPGKIYGERNKQYR